LSSGFFKKFRSAYGIVCYKWYRYRKEIGLKVKSADRLLAYDIGGSHISAGLCLLEPLSVGRTAIAPLADTITSHAFLSLLQDLGQQLMCCEEETAGASLAFPGPFDYEAGISHMCHKLKALNGVDLRTAFACRLGWAPEQIRFLNDANAAMLGEIGAGAARGASRAVGIVLGTGIGSAFVQDGDLITDGEGIPPGGEIWNLPFMDGIVEDQLSARAIQGEYEARTGEHLSVEAISLRAATDPDAQAVFKILGQHLGAAIGQILAPFCPDVVVLGGGISRSSHLFMPAAQSQLNGLGIRLVPSVLLQEAPLLGAAMYWRDGASRASADCPAFIDAK
jgi:glucokinase